jgi:hypothetical protein
MGFNMNVIGAATMVLAFAWPAFILPVILGLAIFASYRRDRLSQLAGLFAFKPVIATPLWAILFALTARLLSPLAPGREPYPLSPLYFLTLFPGVILTLLIVIAFRQLFMTGSKLAYSLLVLDVMRWMNTFLAYFVWMSPESGSIGWSMYIAGILFSNLYAIVALIICIFQANKTLPAPGPTAAE